MIEDLVVGSTPEAQFNDMLGLRACSPKSLKKGSRKIFVDKKPHRLLDSANLAFSRRAGHDGQA